jgi:hypothetical protein
MPPPEYRNTEASDQRDCLEAHFYPVPNWRGISLNKPIRPVEKQPVYKIGIEVRDFPLGKAIP